MTARLRQRASADDGFTLIELLVALALGSIVLTALMTVFVNGLTASGKVTDRVEAGARARLTADRITTLLGSQVCANGNAPVTVATPTSVTFTSNTGTVDAQPTRYRIWWDSATRNVYEDRWVATNPNGPGDPIWPASITRTDTIGVQMMPADGANLFTYYGFDTVNGGISATPMATIVPSRVIAVRFALTAIPERTKQATDARATTITGQSVAGTADPADFDKGNKC